MLLVSFSWRGGEGPGMEICKVVIWRASIFECLEGYDLLKSFIYLFICFFFWCSQKGVHQLYTAAAAAKSLQSCLTLCDPIDGSPPDSPIPGILQARTLEWVAISFIYLLYFYSVYVCAQWHNHVWCQEKLGLGLGLATQGLDCHFLLQGIFPTQGSNPGLLHCRQICLLIEPPGKA